MVALATAMVLLALPGPAGAEEETPSTWREPWPKFRWWEYGVTAASWGTTITTGYILPDTPFGWRGRNDFDEAIRDELRWGSTTARHQAAVASDVMFYSLSALPIVVDDLVVTWGVRRKRETAYHLIMTDLEALGVAGFVSSLTERTGRERPYVRTCPDGTVERHADALSPELPCQETGRNQSFVSGHTAAAFAGAGLVCVHRTAFSVFGARAADVAMCSTALGTAVVAAYLRVASDVHYTTDVLAAAGVGLGSGFVLPYLIRFRSAAVSPFGMAVAPLAARDVVGLSVRGQLP